MFLDILPKPFIKGKLKTIFLVFYSLRIRMAVSSRLAPRHQKRQQRETVVFAGKFISINRGQGLSPKCQKHHILNFLLIETESGSTDCVGVVFTLYRTTFAPAEKPYCSAEPLFTNENSDFGVISVTERSWVAPFSKLESHISDRCSHYAASDSFACWQEKLCGIVNIALLWRYWSR